MSTKTKGNMFGSFGEAAEQREQEQRQIEAVVTRTQPKIESMVARKRGPDATTMTLAISKADKQLVKAYAARQSTTVSDLLHQWIQDHCQ